MRQDDSLWREIEDLRDRLDGYHEHLEQALDHNHEFQMRATWGVVQGVSSLLSYFGSIWLMDKVWRWAFDAAPGWIGGVLIGVLSLVVIGVMGAYVEKGRKADMAKLMRWPRWRRIQD